MPATGNVVYLQSDAGDYIGAGMTKTYTPLDSVIEIGGGGMTTAGNRFQLTVKSDEEWTGFFQAMSTLPDLRPGYYGNLQQFPGQQSHHRRNFLGRRRARLQQGDGLVRHRQRHVLRQHSGFDRAALRAALRRSHSRVARADPLVSCRYAPTLAAAGSAAGGSVVTARGRDACQRQLRLSAERGGRLGGSRPDAPLHFAGLCHRDEHFGKPAQRRGRGRSALGRLFHSDGSADAVASGLLRQPHDPEYRQRQSQLARRRSGCNGLNGWFVVDDVSYVSGSLTSIELRFEQHCDGATAPPLRGKIRWRFDDPTQPPGPQNPPPAGLWTPAAGATPATGNFFYLESEPGEYLGQGRVLLFTADNATFETATFAREFIVGVHPAGGNWAAHFDHMSSIPRLQPGYYPDVQRLFLHNPTRPGMDIHGEGRSCETVSGWFVIDSVTYTGTTVTAIDVTFEQRCNNSAADLHGRIRWSQ